MNDDEFDLFLNYIRIVVDYGYVSGKLDALNNAHIMWAMSSPRSDLTIRLEDEYRLLKSVLVKATNS